MNKGGVARSGTMLALFAVAIILLPFNALPYFKSIFREMANEGAFYPLMLAVLFYVLHLLNGVKIHLPRHPSFAILVVFVTWVGISGAGNFLGIIEGFTKGRSGTEKYILQFVLLLFVFSSSLLIYQLARLDVLVFLLKFRRYAAYSLLPVSVYCIVEILAISGDGSAKTLLQNIDYFIRDEEIGLAIFRRLRSVSGEPSYFAMYISFVFPWVCSYLITQTKRHWPYLVLVTYLIVLIVFTFSRSAYGVIGFQIILLILGAFIYTNKAISHQRSIALWAVPLLVVAVVGGVAFEVIPLDAVGGVLVSLLDTENISNIGRYGSQAAALGMAVDNPVFGIGFGQYGFKMPDYVPDWAKISPEIIEWMSSSPDSVWAPALGLYARVAGELGFVGLALWGALWISLLRSCYRRFKLNNIRMSQCDGIGLALLVSMIGVLMAGFNSDSLRFFGYWILLGLCWAYLDLPLANGKRGSVPNDPLGGRT